MFKEPTKEEIQQREDDALDELVFKTKSIEEIAEMIDAGKYHDAIFELFRGNVKSIVKDTGIRDSILIQAGAGLSVIANDMPGAVPPDLFPRGLKIVYEAIKVYAPDICIKSLTNPLDALEAEGFRRLIAADISKALDKRIAEYQANEDPVSVMVNKMIDKDNEIANKNMHIQRLLAEIEDLRHTIARDTRNG